ncbi:MAG: sugar phosphate nucleotidyltransferase [Anaerolineales bacterium]|nr:sugar phosphate nucleotidyltransferase [Anaerolineales bacterium]
MNQTSRSAYSVKIVIPTAGWGTRMRPQTWSKPKPLISVAGKTALDHALDTYKTVPDLKNVEYVIILGPFLGEQQIPLHMQQHYPQARVHYVLQSVMKGQSDALWLARQYLSGPMLMVFSDTLIETDFSFLANESADGVAWVKAVPDPRRFGVAEVDKDGWVTHFTEKPETCDNNLAVVGCYYFKSGEALISAIEEQFRRKVECKGEYFLVDAINILLERGAKMRTQSVDIWLDTGTIEATLETNRYLLERLNVPTFQPSNVKIVPPVFIHETAEIVNSTIGPYVSIGAGCKITDSRIEDSILEAGVTVDAAALTGSFIGRQAKVEGRGAEGQPMKLNIGDDSSVKL